MRYYKMTEGTYIIAIGTGSGGTEITEQEYNTIMAVIQQKPPKTATTDFRLKTDLAWEEYPHVGPEPEPEAPDNFKESAEYIVENGLMEFPEIEEPDYFNEREPEPNYFG